MHTFDTSLDRVRITCSAVTTPCCRRISRLYVLQNQSYCQSKVYIVGIGIFNHICSRDCDLELDPMTFTYELDHIPQDILDVRK